MVLIIQLYIMLKLMLLLLLINISFTLMQCARILAVFPTPAISHQMVFKPIIHRLAQRGHQVTVIATDPFNRKVNPLPNIKEIDIHDVSYKIWKESFFNDTDKMKNDLLIQMKIGLRSVSNLFEKQMEIEEVKSFILKKDDNFDLIIVEAWVFITLALTHVFNVPAIQISSFGVLPYNFKTIGAPTHPLVHPASVSRKIYDLRTWEKFKELWFHWRIENVYDDSEEEIDSRLKEIFYPDIPTISNLAKNVCMIFVSCHHMWEDHRPVPLNFVFMRGVHMKPKKELPKDLQSYLDSSKNGVIYISFGTTVLPSLLPPEKTQMLIRVFSKLPYDVIWKWDNDTLEGKSKNIKIMKWLPQSDLLQHSNVKLFITQGGLQSTDEAIHAGVPLIGLPILGDQWYNTEKYVYHKIGKQLDMPTLTEDQFRDAIETVINDKSYRENIIRLRTLLEDERMPPLKRAVWWIEYVIRYDGGKHLQTSAANMSWAEYYELDLIVILISVILTLFTVVCFIIYTLWKIVLRNYKAIKIKYC